MMTHEGAFPAQYMPNCGLAVLDTSAAFPAASRARLQICGWTIAIRPGNLFDQR